MHRTLVTAALGAAMLVPAAAGAQDIEHRGVRLGGHLALGLAGELDAYINDSGTEVDLEPSVGFELRAEVPVLDFLVVGGSFGFLSVEAEPSPWTGAWEREETFSFSGYVRGRWVFEAIRSTLFVEPYVLVPLGFTMAVLPDGGRDDEIWPGWNTGVLFGAQLLHRSGFGGYVEMGWRHAEVYREQATIFGTADLSLVLNEMALSFGFVYVLGA